MYEGKKRNLVFLYQKWDRVVSETKRVTTKTQLQNYAKEQWIF